MQIWVDADACPKIVKEILFRAVARTKTPITLVANQLLQVPLSPLIKKIQVPSGLDVADYYIIDNLKKGDLVITADIPLADAVVTKESTALNPRGELYTRENIKQRLAVRDFSAELRSGGLVTGGPSALTQKEIQAFANSLDRFLAQNKPVKHQ